MFLEPQQSALGLDISDRSLKAAQLKRTLSGQLTIAALSAIDVPVGIFDDGEIKDTDYLVAAIVEMLSKPQFGAFSTSYVVACLPETKTFIKMIDVPPMPADEMAQAVKWEAEHHIPIPIEDTYWDWQQIEFKKEANTRQPVLLAVVPKNIVDSYTLAITNARLVPVALEVEAVPITRSLLPYSAEDNNPHATMIIDLGATRTGLIVVDLNCIQFTVSLPISGRRVTETIAGSLKLTEDQAEKAKIICGLDPKKCHGAMREILQQMMDHLVNRIQEAVIFYREHFPQGNKINEIILCGGGSNLKQIDKYLSAKLNLPVRRGDPCRNLTTDSNTPKPDVLIGYTTAIGLALRTSLNSPAYD